MFFYFSVNSDFITLLCEIITTGTIIKLNYMIIIYIIKFLFIYISKEKKLYFQRIIIYQMVP